jgi:hypothetical protein
LGNNVATTLSLDKLAEASLAMDERPAVKALLRP